MKAQLTTLKRNSASPAVAQVVVVAEAKVALAAAESLVALHAATDLAEAAVETVAHAKKAARAVMVAVV